MRCDQYVGLNERAAALVAGEKVLIYTETVLRTFPDGSTQRIGPLEVRGSNVIREVIGTIAGAYDDVAGELFRYRFADGRVYDEFVQETIWSSGPMYYVALLDVDAGAAVAESLWTHEELHGCEDPYDGGFDDSDDAVVGELADWERALLDEAAGSA